MNEIDVFILALRFLSKILCHHIPTNDRRFMMVLNFVSVTGDRDYLLLVTIFRETAETTAAPCVPSMR
jgi:hypothetical protein